MSYTLTHLHIYTLTSISSFQGASHIFFHSATGTRTRMAWVKAEYSSQLHCGGMVRERKSSVIVFLIKYNSCSIPNFVCMFLYVLYTYTFTRSHCPVHIAEPLSHKVTLPSHHCRAAIAQSPGGRGGRGAFPFLLAFVVAPIYGLGHVCVFSCMCWLKGLRGRNSPTCTLSQNGYGGDCKCV